MRLSVVTTLYHSAPYLREFYRRVVLAVRPLTDAYEIILVNDGSPDNALAVALALRAEDNRVKVIDLSRNFGHHPAMLTGLRYAGGDWVFLLDCDLEEDPELVTRFDAVRRETGADVVFGVQDMRRGSWRDRLSGYLFYKVINALARDAVPENLMTVRLMSRRYVEALLRHREVEVNISGLWARTGFLQVPVSVSKRPKGSSTYNLPRKMAILVNAVTSMSAQPLVFVFYLGSVISGLAVGAALVLIARRLFLGEMLAGWPSLIVSIWLLGGLTIFCQGVIGIYLAKVVMEVKRRPLTLVRAVYGETGREPEADAAPADNGREAPAAALPGRGR
jgi:putative glycosyltransferase